MNFRSRESSQTGGGIAGFFRPIIKFFRNIIAPIAKTAIKSSVGKKSIKALKDAGIGITADAISGGFSKEGAKGHITKARNKVAQALLDTRKSVTHRNKDNPTTRKNRYKKKKKSKVGKKGSIGKEARDDFFID